MEDRRPSPENRHFGHDLSSQVVVDRDVKGWSLGSPTSKRSFTCERHLQKGRMLSILRKQPQEHTGREEHTGN